MNKHIITVKNKQATNSSEQKRVAIFGAFDIVHPGHISLLKQAKKLGQVFVVVARDSTIHKVKGRLPYFKATARQKNLEGLKLADKIILGDNTNPYKVLDIIKPKIILLGPDQKAFVNHLHEELAQRKLITTILRAQPLQIDIFKSSKIRPSLEDRTRSGFLLINKSPGISSHDVVNNLRKIVGSKRIGHAGTLDPLATGILVCGINQATKLLSWWQCFPKTYMTTLELGKKSDTYDKEGKIIKVNDRPIKKQELQKILSQFTGKLWQLPPPFSAKKIKGKKAYQLARAGKNFKLKKQKINIYSLSLINFKYPCAQLEINCSSGTYIRSLVNDIGNKLKTGAIITALERTALGKIKLSDTISLDNLSSNNWQKKLLAADQLLSDINNHFLSQT